MSAFLVILTGLWLYPVMSYVAMRLTQKRPGWQRKLLIGASLLTCITILGLLTDVSTTWSRFDWWMVSTVYFTISLLLFWFFFQKNKILKTVAGITMGLVWGVGYSAATIGVLGLGFIVSDYETDYEQWLGDGLVYKESRLGNAVSDQRGKKVEVYQTISWFPFVEWRKQVKVYDELITLTTTPLTVVYKPESNYLVLNASRWQEKEQAYVYWTDSLRIK